MHKCLRILHTESSCGWGGQEIRILTEMRAFQARGHDVHLVCCTDSPIYHEAVKRGLKVTALPIFKKRVTAWLAMRQFVRKHCHDFHVINTHSSTDSWLVALATLGVQDAPVIIRTRHVSSPINNHRSTHWLYQRAAKHIVVTGEALRKQLHEQNQFAMSSMTSIPTGIDLAVFSPGEKASARAETGTPSDAFVIGILATLRSWKGHEFLLRALRQLLDEAWQDCVPEGCQLLIVGDGPYRDTLERLVDELAVRPYVRFVGNQEVVTPWLRSMDIFVLPSYGDEGVPQAIMQAMACGLPVISTGVGAIREAVEHQETGVIVQPKNAREIAEALNLLYEDTTLRTQYGAAALAKAQRQFGMQVMLEKMEKVFYEYACD